MAGSRTDARVIARLDEEEQALLRRARAATGKNNSSIIKAALRLYAQTLPDRSALEIFEDCGLVDASSGPTDLSENYKGRLDFSSKHHKR